MSKMGLDRQLSSFKRSKKILMRELSRNSKDFFQKTNFSSQSFVDVPSSRWKALKKPRPGLILVKTGALRRSAKWKVTGSNRASVMFTVPYASFHNDGAGRLPKRQFSGESKILNKQNEKILLNYTKKHFR